ncbi:MAG: hypothetical protein GX465_17625 [Acidobacteria bacterium]|nr:hypothetical protein [Acidobacteriota bacterium]
MRRLLVLMLLALWVAAALAATPAPVVPGPLDEPVPSYGVYSVVGKETTLLSQLYAERSRANAVAPGFTIEWFYHRVGAGKPYGPYMLRIRWHGHEAVRVGDARECLLSALLSVHMWRRAGELPPIG